MARTPTSSVTWEEFIDELLEKNKELKAKINKVIELFKSWDSSDLYDYIDDLDYEED